MSKHLEHLRNEVARLTELERGSTGAVNRLKRQRDKLKAENDRLKADRDRLRTAAQEAIVAMAALVYSDQQKPYTEIGEELREAIISAKDAVKAALATEPTPEQGAERGGE